MELRQLRERTGLSREQVADATDINRATLYRIETAQAKPQVRTLRALLDVYGVPTARQDELVAILRLAKEESWLHGTTESLPGQYATYIGFESEAKGLLNYESSFVPGLLQTEAYARAAIPGGDPELPSQEVESRVVARMTRQARRDPSLNLWTIIDEAVLHRQVGGPKVMRQQLQQLIDVSDQPQVTLQVIPYEVGVHPGMHGSFVILQFAEGVHDVVYIETSAADLFLESEKDLRRYNLIFEQLQTVAASPTESRHLIARLLVDTE
ncbi:helix-turn-helix domain-containing protein [Nonomuraea cavernae]|uniref:Transcriptional regulator n=1 Tax=Nonomuraea cavernae TaxID=2045107 RepID=A0A917ZE53_9ACTN|nr:helix-turn-helix transcriptional regulator [Nonomuraea cavernae]MCA2189537.1 helix-turn-helix domain-containing protein [Nonomuraea cavernae]GGO81680.1 transcriptional regulator [Nonomuraea cavernae]